jgi:polyphosphate kinase 2 (PPK2 family)
MNALQTQQARLNKIVSQLDQPVAVVLEGRDSAGKSGTIREVTHYLPTDLFSVCLSTMPSKRTMKNWLPFWSRKLPTRPMVTFFDRSWYSRAMVQPLNGWCTDKQYAGFMKRVSDWEGGHSNVRFIKFWLSISESEQAARLGERETSPLKSWKMSPNDRRALSTFDQMTILKERVLSRGGWHSLDYNDKAQGRLDFITTLCDLLEKKSL